MWKISASGRALTLSGHGFPLASSSADTRRSPQEVHLLVVAGTEVEQAQKRNRQTDRYRGRDRRRDGQGCRRWKVAEVAILAAAAGGALLPRRRRTSPPTPATTTTACGPQSSLLSLMFSKPISNRKQTLAAALHRVISLSSSSSLPPPSNLSSYGFKPPPSFSPRDPSQAATGGGSGTPGRRRKEKPRYRPPSSLDREGQPPLFSDLPFDFRFSYTESNPDVKPIGLREPKYSPFGPGRIDRIWTGTCAPAVDPTVRSVDGDDDAVGGEGKKAPRRKSREEILGEPLTPAERKALIESCQKHRTKRQINLGRDGLTHNMLNDIHNNWKHAEAVRIKCLGVPTVDMDNVCTQLEDKTGGQIIQRQGGTVILYRGRYYHPKKRPAIPLMLWKPHEPIYPKLIKTVVDGLTVEETKEMRKKGLAVPALTQLAKNGYYGNLVTMVRDAFMIDELVRIDCKGLERSDYKKIGVKLRDLVPCVLVTFEKEQIVVWKGKNYNSTAEPNTGNIPSSTGAESDNNTGENGQKSISQLFDDTSDSDVEQSTPKSPSLSRAVSEA